MSNLEIKAEQKIRMQSNLPSAKVAAFIGPAVILIAIFYFLPGLMTIMLSITDMGFDFNAVFVGLKNYLFILTDPLAGKVILNTLVYVFCTLLLFNIGMGLILALLTSYASKKVATVFRLIWLLPRMTPPLVYILMWKFLLDPSDYGALNILREQLFNAQAINLFAEHPWAIIIIVNGFVGASMGMLVFSSAIESIPKDYYKAARIDGASEWEIIKNITIPMIKWPLMFITVYQTLALLTSFEYIMALTDGGPFYATEVWSLYAYHNALQYFDFSYGAALASVLVLIGIIASMFYWKVFRFENSVVEPKIEIN